MEPGPDEQEARLLAQPLRTITMEFDMAKPISRALAALLVLAGPLTTRTGLCRRLHRLRRWRAPAERLQSGHRDGVNLPCEPGPGSNYRKIGELYARVTRCLAYDRPLATGMR